MKPLITPTEFIQIYRPRPVYIRGAFLTWVETNYPDEDKFTEEDLEKLLAHFRTYF